MAFDLDVGGHHAGYLQNLVRIWASEERRGRLSLAVSPELLDQHPELVADARNADVPVLPVSLPPVASSWLAKAPAELRLAERALREWRALCESAVRLSATHALSMYMDGLIQTPLALGLRAPCRISGIYFRPTFHYGGFSSVERPLRDRLKAARQRVLAGRALRHPALDVMFCLDPYAVDAMRAGLREGHKARHLADPVAVHDEPEGTIAALRRELGLSPEKTVLLLFGMITPRKGLLEVLEALEHLPPPVAREVCLLVVGPMAADFRGRVHSAVERARGRTGATILLHERFVPDLENQRWFGVADIVLAPYQQHVGMSAILIRAASAGKPIIADGYGLLGQLTERRRLGAVVDARDPRAIAHGIERLLRSEGGLVDAEAQGQLARENTPAAFARAMFSTFLPEAAPSSG